MGKTITFDLFLQEINDKINEVKIDKKGNTEVRNIRTVKFHDPDSGMSMAIRDRKYNHPLKNWDASMFEEFAPITITIEMPEVTQTKLDDFNDK